MTTIFLVIRNIYLVLFLTKIHCGDHNLFTHLCTASFDEIPKDSVTERYSVVVSDLEVGRPCPSTFPLELVCDCVLAEVLMLSWFVLYSGHSL